MKNIFIVPGWVILIELVYWIITQYNIKKKFGTLKSQDSQWEQIDRNLKMCVFNVSLNALIIVMGVALWFI